VTRDSTGTGGEPLGKGHIYWNLVSGSKERIEQAKSDWRERKFGEIPGETEFIPCRTR
jgi:hypothetical protein